MKTGGNKDKRPTDIARMARLNLSPEETKQFEELMERERRGLSNMATILVAEALRARRVTKVP